MRAAPELKLQWPVEAERPAAPPPYRLYPWSGRPPAANEGDPEPGNPARALVLHPGFGTSLQVAAGLDPFRRTRRRAAKHDSMLSWRMENREVRAWKGLRGWEPYRKTCRLSCRPRLPVLPTTRSDTRCLSLVQHQVPWLNTRRHVIPTARVGPLGLAPHGRSTVVWQQCVTPRPSAPVSSSSN